YDGEPRTRLALQGHVRAPRREPIGDRDAVDDVALDANRGSEKTLELERRRRIFTTRAVRVLGHDVPNRRLDARLQRIVEPAVIPHADDGAAAAEDARRLAQRSSSIDAVERRAEGHDVA